MKENLENECLEELGGRFKVIAKRNEEVIKKIISRKSDLLVCGHSFTLNCETRSKPWLIESTPFKSPVSMRLRNWRYNGEKLEEPEDIFNDKINYTLETWEDVHRLNEELQKVGCKFSDRLADRIENRRDMWKILENIIKISHSLEDIVKLTEDMVDPVKKYEKTIFEALEEKLKGFDFTLDAKLVVGDPFEYFDNKVNFDSIKKWGQPKCFSCVSNRASDYDNKKSYYPSIFVFNDKPHVAIPFSGCVKGAMGSNRIKQQGFEVWDLSIEHQVQYKHECVHANMLSVLACRKNGKEILISRSNSDAIIWQVGKSSSCDKLPINTVNRTITALAETVKEEGSSIVACGYSDGVIELWDINEMKIVKELNSSSYFDIEFIKFLDEDTLVSMNAKGVIDFWWIRTNTFKTSSSVLPRSTITAYFHNQKPFVVLTSSNADKSLSLSTWDVLNNKVHKSTKSFTSISSLTVIYSNDTPYLVLNHDSSQEIINVSTYAKVTSLSSFGQSTSKIFHPFKIGTVSFLPAIKSTSTQSQKYNSSGYGDGYEYILTHQVCLWSNNNENHADSG